MTLERSLAPGRPDLPPLVFLHEGLGSLGLWRDFPDRVASASGGRTTLVYTRAGYGRSSPVPLPRPMTYMHVEAMTVLPELLAETGLHRPVLIGHSDGASIAIIHAGAGHPVSALVLLAPHVFVEDRSIAGIEAARVAYDSGDLRDRLTRHHADVDNAFRGWNDVWLDPAFRSWDITPSLPGITCPVLVVQGDHDEYGTLAQVDAVQAGVAGPVQRVVLAGVGHAPHVDRPDEVTAAIVRFLGR